VEEHGGMDHMILSSEELTAWWDFTLTAAYRSHLLQAIGGIPGVDCNTEARKHHPLDRLWLHELRRISDSEDGAKGTT